MESYSWLFYIQVFAGLSIVFHLIALPRIKRGSATYWNKKSFWKSVDYLWILLAVCGMAFAIISYNIKDADAQLSDIQTQLADYKTALTQALETDGSGTTNSDDCFVHKGFGIDNLQELLRKREKPSACQWSRLVHDVLIVSPQIANKRRDISDSIMAAYLVYLVGELNPESDRSTSDYKDLANEAALERFMHRGDISVPKINETAVEFTGRMWSKQRCSTPIDLLSALFADGDKKPNKLQVTNVYCELSDAALAAALSREKWESQHSLPILFYPNLWELLIAFGLAVRVTRTSAEAKIDRLAGN